MDSQLLPILARFIALVTSVICPMDEHGLPREGGLVSVRSIGLAYVGQSLIPVMQAILLDPMGQFRVVEVYAEPVEPVQGKLAFTFAEIGACVAGSPQRAIVLQKLRTFLLGILPGTVPMEC